MNVSIRESVRDVLLAAGPLGLLMAGVAQAAPIQSLSNPVGDNWINTAASNNDRSDWAGITPYGADGNESATADWATVFVAHDSTKFYLRYAMNSVTNANGWLDGNQNMFIDADQSNATGFNGAMAIGADYLLQGGSLFSYGGSGGSSWAWNWVGGLAYDDFPSHDHEITLPRALIGSPESFNFVLFASGVPEDYYPDGGNLGAVSGTSFNYTTVPEPATMGLLAAGGLAALRRRRK